MIRNDVLDRRRFLGRMTAGGAALGLALADRLGLSEAFAAAPLDRLRFGALDPLVDLIQATPADALLPQLVAKLKAGATLEQIVGATALANARAHGGGDYAGYHALMALAPSIEMSAQMPAELAALPVLKVVHRNARTIQDGGKARHDALEPIAAGAAKDGLVAATRRFERDAAEASLQDSVGRSLPHAYDELQVVVRDDANVHRIVLAWRALDLLRFAGEQHALTMFRQPVRFCIDEDSQRASRQPGPRQPGELIEKLLDEHRLRSRERGTRQLDAAAIERLAAAFFADDREAAAAAAAAALADGADLESIGAAMTLAATRLLLHDPGARKAAPGRDLGSVHGASVGVHASDAANAWRHVARVTSGSTPFASLIAGAYHTAGQARYVGAQPFDHDAAPMSASDPAQLLRDLEGRIRERDQRGASLAARRYAELGHDASALFALLLRYAVSEDGALHAEKYFRTVQEEHALAQPGHRPLLLAALARVTASEFGRPAPGCEEARMLLAG